MTSSKKNNEWLQKMARSKLISRRIKIMEDPETIELAKQILTNRQFQRIESEAVWYKARKSKKVSKWMQSVIDMKKDGIIK